MLFSVDGDGTIWRKWQEEEAQMPVFGRKVCLFFFYLTYIYLVYYKQLSHKITCCKSRCRAPGGAVSTYAAITVSFLFLLVFIHIHTNYYI